MMLLKSCPEKSGETKVHVENICVVWGGKQIVFLKEPESDRGSTRRARRRAGAPREQAMLPAAPAGIAFTGRERGHVSKKSKKKRETVNYKREK